MEYIGEMQLAEGLFIDFDNAELFIKEPERRAVALKKKAFDLLKYLFENKGVTVSVDMIFDTVWGYDSETQIEQVKQNISQLRAAIDELLPGMGKTVIKNKHSIGYCIERPSGEEARTAKAAPAFSDEFERRFKDSMLEDSNRHYEKAIKINLELAEKGYAPSINYIGTCYAKGRVFEKSFEKAFELYEKAAKIGYAAAQFNLGDMYENGRCVRYDPEEAVKWYIAAATNPENPDGDAMFRLSRCYEEGRGVTVDKNEAEKWRLLAKENGVTEYINFYS